MCIRDESKEQVAGYKTCTSAKLRALSFCQNWPAGSISLQGKCNNLKEHMHDNPSHSSGGVYIILEVC